MNPIWILYASIGILHESHMSPIWILHKSHMNPRWILYESYETPKWILHEPHMNPRWVLNESCMNPIWILTESYMNPISEPSVDNVCLQRRQCFRAQARVQQIWTQYGHRTDTERRHVFCAQAQGKRRRRSRARSRGRSRGRSRRTPLGQLYGILFLPLLEPSSVNAIRELMMIYADVCWFMKSCVDFYTVLWWCLNTCDELCIFWCF